MVTVKKPIINNVNDTKATNCDYDISADDANIDFNKSNEIPTKITLYE